MNFFPGRVAEKAGAVCVELGAGGPSLAVAASRQERFRPLAGREVTVGIRPEDIRLASAAPDDQPVEASVVVAEPLGAETLLTLSGPAGEFVARVGPDSAFVTRAPVRAWVDMAKLHAFDVASGEALALD